LSLTIVRVLPMYVALAGSGESQRTRLFLGWFGPRGLASIVFAVIVLDTGLPGAEMMSIVVASTVLFSLIAHGVSARLAKHVY
jgi:NhaP-type Na+/H+ or K+/H+ antiporter